MEVVVRLPFKQKTPHFSVRGFANLASFSAYAPVRPAPVGEVIRTSTRMDTDAPRGAGVSFIVGVWRCSMTVGKHALPTLVKHPEWMAAMQAMDLPGLRANLRKPLEFKAGTVAFATLRGSPDCAKSRRFPPVRTPASTCLNTVQKPPPLAAIWPAPAPCGVPPA